MKLQVRSPVMVGREDELSRMEDALLAANRGRGPFVLLSADAGVGKSRPASPLYGKQRVGSVLLGPLQDEAPVLIRFLERRKVAAVVQSHQIRARNGARDRLGLRGAAYQI